MTDQEKVYQALQRWRDSDETQKSMSEKPAVYDAVIKMQSEAISIASAQDWAAWAKTASREDPRAVAMEIAMVGRNIQRLKDKPQCPRLKGGNEHGA